MRTTIAIDIDGVLTNETKGVPYAKRTPNLDNIDRVEKLYRLGYRIILFTSRFERDRRLTQRWLAYHKVPYHKLVMSKLRFTFIWDDKAISEHSIDTLIRREESYGTGNDK